MRRTHRIIQATATALIVGCAACINLPSFTSPGPVTTPTGDEVTPTPTPSPDATDIPASPGPTATPTTTPVYTSNLHQSEGFVADGTGKRIELHGIGWWGFDLGPMLNMPPVDNRLGSDVVVVMQRLRLMGFNLIQIPFSFAQLYQVDGSRLYPASTIRKPCSGSSSAADIIASVAPAFTPAANTPMLTNVPASTPGMCNDYLPDTNSPVVARLAAIIDIFTRNGFYVLLQQTMKGDTALWNAQPTFANRWGALAADIVLYGGNNQGLSQASCAVDPNHAPLALCRNLILGLMTDLEGITPQMTWDAAPGGSRGFGAHTFYVSARTQVASVFPRAMFLINGAIQTPYITTFETGVDARTDAYFQAAVGDPAVNSAAAFFADTLGTPYQAKTMFGFSAFGPTTNGDLALHESNIAAQVAQDLDWSYGRVAYNGVPDASSVSHPFPVMPSSFGANPSDANDSAFLQAMKAYMATHNMPHFVWWCWGATSTNSSIVSDMQQFTTLNMPVINYLKTLNLGSNAP